MSGGADPVETAWVDRARAAAAGRRVVGVMGGGSTTAAIARLAEAFGRAAAARSYALLTGGGGGIMEAAARGACAAGGVSIGVLPVAAPDGAYPNRFVTAPLFTGLGVYDPSTGDPGRNRVNILAADVVAAFPGAAGTNSEIRLAATHGRPLVLVGWCLADLEATSREALAARGVTPIEAATPQAAVDAIDAISRA